MSYLDDLKIKQAGSVNDASVQEKRMARLLPTQTEIIMSEILQRTRLDQTTEAKKYKNINRILAVRDEISNEIKNAGLNEGEAVIGGITEQICKMALNAVARKRYEQLPNQWKWIGDYAITGLPFNLYISVKSYYARERLIVSGSGQEAAPVIGFGLFKDEAEWPAERVTQYLHRGFVAIYMPSELYNVLESRNGVDFLATDIKNTYGNPFLRKIEDFANDLKRIVNSNDLILDLKKF